ncbi:MAG: T9SS type A sorting domain-containing protein [Ignavibacteriaceae bacterium]
MRIKFLLLTLLLSTQIFFDLSAQELPFVYDVENRAADYPVHFMPSVGQLPTIPNLPDPFEWSDGRGRITSIHDWQYRRAEIGAEIQNYEIGEKPVRPDTIEASFANGVLTVKVTVNGRSLTLNSEVILPEGTGPFPAIIGMGGPSGSVPGDILSERNIARITYNHDDVTTYNAAQNSDPYYQLYPHLNLTNTGQYSAWVWGVSRLIDGLELVQGVLPIDLEHLAVSGCSYAGKMALFAGAFDERIALTIAYESGGGGYTTWRYSQEINKTVRVETLGNTNYDWFKDRMMDFSSQVSKLPEDHHELMAMVAPRALFVAGNPSYEWMADESGHVGSNAAKEVWNALGVPDRFGYSIVGDHGHCVPTETQISEFEAFLDKFLLGIDTVNTNIAVTPYNTNLAPWITWATPLLSNDPSTAKWTSLIYPAIGQSDMERSVTFSWSDVEDAEKYIIQITTDPAFINIAITDSTADTTLTIDNLIDAKRHYWRVRVKSADGSSGPWSEIWDFSTYAPMPAQPEIVSADSIAGVTDSLTFKWKKVEYADKYHIQLSYSENFSVLVKRDSTADTTITLGKFTEARRYHWRILSTNVTGSSSWSQSSFLIFLAPEGLNLNISESNKINLTWVDRSKAENGYIIERKDEQSSFIVLDTLERNSGSYTDSNVVQGQTYTYRVKAYKDTFETNYTNEATVILVGVGGRNSIPEEYALSQNYPNPFNPATIIKFALPQAALTKITIYNLLGKEIQTLINEEIEAGYHEVSFDASSFPSGVYFYRIQSGNFIHTKKMILMK